MQCVFCCARQLFKRLYQQVKALFCMQDEVPEEVKVALQQRRGMNDLLDFLFSTDFHRDEAFMQLFERRIQELDAACQPTAILHY
jgi:hypothetical protein